MSRCGMGSSWRALGLNMTRFGPKFMRFMALHRLSYRVVLGVETHVPDSLVAEKTRKLAGEGWCASFALGQRSSEEWGTQAACDDAEGASGWGQRRSCCVHPQRHPDVQVAERDRRALH